MGRQRSGGAGLTVGIRRAGGREVGCGCHTKGLEERVRYLKRVAAAADSGLALAPARLLSSKQGSWPAGGGPNLQSLVGHAVGR